MHSGLVNASSLGGNQNVNIDQPAERAGSLDLWRETLERHPRGNLGHWLGHHTNNK